MKQITPMARLKSHFKTFEINIGNIASEFNLSKSAPKYNPYGGESGYGGSSKGVKSDFIKIYKINEKDSFAFSFNGITSDTTKTLITVSIKHNEDLVSVVTSFEGFKAKIKSLNSVLEVLSSMEKLSGKSLLSTIDNTFGINTPESSIEEVSKQIKQKITEEVSIIKKQISSKKHLKKTNQAELYLALEEFDIIEAKTKEEVDYAKKEKAFLKAQKAFKEAISKVDSKTSKYKKTVETLQSVDRREERNITNLTANIKDIIKVATFSYSPSIRETVSKLFKIV